MLFAIIVALPLGIWFASRHCVGERPQALPKSTSDVAVSAQNCRPDCVGTATKSAPSAGERQCRPTATDHTNMVRPVSRSTGINARPPSPLRTGSAARTASGTATKPTPHHG